MADAADNGIRPDGDMLIRQEWATRSEMSAEEFSHLLGHEYAEWAYPYYLDSVEQIDGTHFVANIGKHVGR